MSGNLHDSFRIERLAPHGEAHANRDGHRGADVVRLNPAADFNVTRLPRTYQQVIAQPHLRARLNLPEVALHPPDLPFPRHVDIAPDVISDRVGQKRRTLLFPTLAC